MDIWIGIDDVHMKMAILNWLDYIGQCCLHSIHCVHSIQCISTTKMGDQLRKPGLYGCYLQVDMRIIQDLNLRLHTGGYHISHLGSLVSVND